MDLISENCLGSLYTNGTIGTLVLSLKEQLFSLRFCEFINVRKKLNATNWEHILLNTNKLDDNHLISLNLRGHSVLLDLREALLLWELFNAAHYVFSLNDLLNRNRMSSEFNLPLSLTNEAQLSEI